MRLILAGEEVQKRFVERMSRLGGEAARFIGLGVISYLLGIGLSALFREILGLSEEISVALSLAILIVVNFWLNKQFVFRAAGSSLPQLVRFAATAVGSRAAEYVMFLALLRWVKLNYLVALTVVLIISSCLKFLLYRQLVFGRQVGKLGTTTPAAGAKRVRHDGS
jgi:putative flippase GtrA